MDNEGSAGHGSNKQCYISIKSGRIRCKFLDEMKYNIHNIIIVHFSKVA